MLGAWGSGLGMMWGSWSGAGAWTAGASAPFGFAVPMLPVLWGLGFANYLMLWGTAAASLPILIHLLNRRKFREMPWAAMRFLLAAVKKNQRRVRLEQWLLLAVRTLIVIVVALAMAKPFLESVGALPLIAGKRTHMILVLDGSLSMGYRPAETTRFEQAKTLAQQLAKESRRGDTVSVVLMGSPPRVVIGDPSPNHEEVAREIGEIRPTHGTVDLTATFEAVNRVIAASELTEKQVIFLTDLQTASWRPANGVDNRLKTLFQQFQDRKIRSVVIDLGKSGGANRAVAALELNTPIVTVGAPFVARATVKNYGPNDTSNVRVRLKVDGQFLDERQVDRIAVGEEQGVAFTQVFSSPGDHILEVQIDDDPLSIDNQRALSVPVREKVQLLIVDGDNRPRSFESETDYLAEALSPSSGSEQTANLFGLNIVSEGQLSRRDLSKDDVIVLCNVAQFTDAEEAVLSRFLKQGGGVVIFLGDQVLRDNYNRLLFADGKGLLPVEIQETRGDATTKTQGFRFDPLGYRHPIVAPFAGAGEAVLAGLTGVKTWQFLKVKPPEGSGASVVMAFDDGSPAIVETPRDRGRVIVVTTSADAGWNTWPLHPSYPPVMEQIMIHAASGRFAQRNVRVGQPLDQSFPFAGDAVNATVTRPDDEKSVVKLVNGNDLSQFHYENADLTGTYSLSIGPPIAAEERFCAQADPRESDPDKLDQTALGQALPGWKFAYVTNSRELALDTAAVGQHGELHRALLWALLALLVFESILAWRFGHHR